TLGLGPAGWLLRPVAVLIGNNHVHVTAPPQRSISSEAIYRGQIVRLLPKSVLVESVNGCVDDSGWIETIERWSTRLCDSLRLIFEPGLVRRNFAGLRRPPLSVKFLQTLPAQPAEFVVVPHHHKWPTGARVLQVGVVEIRPVDRAIILNRRRNVKVGNLFAALVPNNIPQPPVVHSLRPVLRIPDDFVDEVTQVKDKSQTIGGGCVLILENHAAERVLCALVGILTTDERKLHCARVARVRCCDCPANPAAQALPAGQPGPQDLCR